MGRVYLVQYGLARPLGRFETLPNLEDETTPVERGTVVVVRTHRGTELGRVLAEAPPEPDSDIPPAPILRVAAPDDLDRDRRASLDRQARFEACRAVFEDGAWPIDLIDAEPLLDEGRTVLHYLGPHKLDASGLVAAFRARCGLDVVLEPAGLDAEEPEPVAEPEPHGCGSCGSSSGGCGSGGGCGSASGGCAVKAMVGARRRVAVDA